MTKKIINKISLKTIYDKNELSLEKVFEDIKYVAGELDDTTAEFKISYSFSDTDYDCENIIYINLLAESLIPIQDDVSVAEYEKKADFEKSLITHYIKKHKGLDSWKIVDIKSSVA